MPVRQRDHAADDDDAAAAAHTRPPKRCKHCDESSQAVGGGAGGAGGECGGGGGCWRVTLDRDLVDTLSAIYPEWFKPQTHNTHLNRRTGVSQEEASGSEEECARMSAGSGGSSPPAPAHPSAPPAAPALDAFAAFAAHPAHLAHAHNAHNAHAVYALAPDAPHVVVDASPLQQAMDKNKESLKVKLMLRRPLNQLVAQGIMPPLKSPPAFHEQRRQLERAKTGDLLKAKIQRRPDRQELERRHILERQEGHVDPSLAEKQRMLKKARLADQLNDQLSHRPGPLELIQKNILHTEEPIEIAVKQGLVAFKATSEGALRRPEHPHSYRGPDDDSPTPSPPSPAATSASFSTLSPASSAASASPRADRPPLAAPPAPPQPPPAPPAPHAPHAPHPPPAPHAPQPPHALLVHQTVSKDRNRKKSKSKSTPKARTIKFHEYKGPPNAHKSSSPPLIDGETSYELLLRQQQLFLQWQLESQHKYPQILFPAKARCAPTASMSSPSPAASVASAASVCSEASDSSPRRPPSPASPAAPPPPPPLPLRLEDMKVSDLKAELKRRSLTVSGSKPHLIERLRAFAAERAPPTPDDRDRDAKSEAPSSPASAAGSPDAHSDLESQPATPQPQPAEDIVRSQRRRIEELQRELQRSQRQLEAVKREAAPAPAPARRLALHHLQAKIHSHQLAAHIQHLQTLQAAAERRAPAAAPPPLPPIAPALPPPARAPPVPLPLAVPVRLPTRYVLAAEPSAERLLRLVPAGDGLKMQFEGLEGFDGDENVGLVLNGVKVVPVTLVPSEPPPRYEEAARAVAASPPAPPPPPPPPPPLPSRSPPVKSEIVDDVLEILIKNGELPASAANLAQDACDGPDFGADDSSPLAGRDALRDDFDVIESELLDSISEKGAIDADRYSDFIMRARDESEYLNGDEPMDEGDRIDDGDLLDDLIRENSERRDFDEAPYLCFHERAPAAEEEATGRPRPSPPWPGRCEGLDLKELGLELESPGPSWPGRAEPEPMDTDEWLEALWPRQPQCDPLLGGAALLPAPRPQRPHFSWDRIDFAAT